MAKRVFNFSAGPGMLPEAVLKKAADEMLDYQGSGMSVMEMSHRSKVYQSIIDGAEKAIRDLMNIPANYKVLFLQGGASAQFEMIPINLLRGKPTADYVHTGEWAKKAIKAAKMFCNVNVVASAEDKNFTYAPDAGQFDGVGDADVDGRRAVALQRGDGDAAHRLVGDLVDDGEAEGLGGAHLERRAVVHRLELRPQRGADARRPQRLVQHRNRDERAE